MNLYEVLQTVRNSNPLVQCITNFVTVNDCANVLLAAGASPTMCMDPREVEEAVTGVEALVCNLGAIEHTDAMLLAGKRANDLGIPAVLDPVAAGVTTLRRQCSSKLLEQITFSSIRGNASEIKALAMGCQCGSGVDVSAADTIQAQNLSESIAMIQSLSKKTGSVIAVSGPMDIVCDPSRTMILYNGCPTMARITGSGCMLTALIGAFCGAVPDDPFRATCAAIATMGICGELAEQQRLEKGTGNATFRTDVIDGLFNLNEKQYKEMIRYELYKR